MGIWAHYHLTSSPITLSFSLPKTHWLPYLSLSRQSIHPPLGVFLLLILLFWALSPQIASLPILHLLQFFAQKTPPGGPCYACALYLSQHPCTPFSKLIFSTMLSPTDILYLFTYTFFCLLTHQLVLNYKPCQDRELIYLENLSCSCCIPHLKEFLPHNSHSVFV